MAARSVPWLTSLARAANAKGSKLEEKVAAQRMGTEAPLCRQMSALVWLGYAR